MRYYWLIHSKADDSFVLLTAEYANADVTELEIEPKENSERNKGTANKHIMCQWSPTSFFFSHYMLINYDVVWSIMYDDMTLYPDYIQSIDLDGL